MIELTEAARQGLVKYFEGKEASPIRIYVSAGGCSGPQMVLALDNPAEGDKVFDFDGGLKVVIDEELLEAAKPVKIDMNPMGFYVESALKFEGGGGCGCSSAGSCGSPGSCCSG